MGANLIASKRNVRFARGVAARVRSASSRGL